MSGEDKVTRRLLLENTFNDIRYTKQQQWHVLYLTLSAIIVITTLALNIEPAPSACFAIWLLFVDIAIGIMGICFLYRYKKDLEKYRNEKEKHMKNLNIQKDKRTGDICCFTVCFSVVIFFILSVSIWALVNYFNCAPR